MLGSVANRPFIMYRWLLYAMFLAAGLVVPYLADNSKKLDIMRSLWVAGAFAVFLILYSLTNLTNSKRLTFPRLGLMIGDTLMPLLFIYFFGGASGGFAIFAIVPPLLIALEHHWKFGLASGFACATFLLGVGGLSTHQVSLSLACLTIPLVGAALQEVDQIKRSLHSEEDLSKLDKAYQIARRETSRRQENEQELYQERRRFEGLVTIAQGLAEEREEASLLSRVVEVASDQLNARGAVVFLLDDGRLEARAESGLSQIMVDGLQECTSAEFLRSLSEMGRPMTFGCENPLEGERDNRALVAKFSRFTDPKSQRKPAEVRIDQLLAVPLSTAQDHQAFGLLLVLNNGLERAFSAAEARYLNVLATNAAIALKNILFTVQLERSHWELIQALAQAIEAKDSYTSNHVGRVRDLSVELARAIGLDQAKTRVIAIAATLHDVGKISTPDRVLLKPGPLTDEEYEIMKQHAANGAQILRNIRSLPEGVEPMVRHHHERWDGRGYPDGKSGKHIPLGAQIISIADCFDAMTYDRPYRKGFPKLEALKKMELGCGTQFNPKLLCAFFAIQGYIPKTEPTAIDTYHAIVGKLRIGGQAGGSSTDAMVNPPYATGATPGKTEQRAKPLLMERN